MGSRNGFPAAEGTELASPSGVGDYLHHVDIVSHCPQLKDMVSTDSEAIGHW
jgi:hypothetical protein